MVRYWKTKLMVEAKVTTDKSGSYIMMMEGEKYPFPGFPRGSILFTFMSKLKHEIKNQIFNKAWKELESGMFEGDVVKGVKEYLFGGIKITDDSKIFQTSFTVGESLLEKMKYFMLPSERMAPMVREVWRAMTVLEKRHNNRKIGILKQILCFILSEDDAYRFRVGWIMKFMGKFRWFGVENVIETLDYALSMLEHAEIVGDMKERQRLLRRILMVCLRDEQIKNLFIELCKEWDWKKLRLTKADKYFFRGKWFRVDYPEYKY